MGLSEENRRDVVNYRIERAYTALDQAKKNLEINCLEVTANRLYYAAYYAVSALLIAYQIPAHTHEGNIQQFGLHFVKNGIDYGIICIGDDYVWNSWKYRLTR